LRRSAAGRCRPAKQAGSGSLRPTLPQAGKDVDEVVAGWQEELEEFRAVREKHLLYGQGGR